MIQVANAPCSWGVIENIEGERYDYSRVLDEIAASGYAGTELGDWGFMPTDPGKLCAELKARDLKLLGSWVNVNFQDANRHDESTEACLRTAELLAAVGGTEALVVLGPDPYTNPMRSLNSGRITPAMSLDAEGWRVFAAGADHAARRVMDETGLRSVLHHHTGTWIETPAETERILEMTDDEVVGLVFDTGHWAFGGGDPLNGIRQFAGRIWYVHFKDHDPAVHEQSRLHEWDGPQSVGQGIFPELGRGDVDFPGVLAELEEIGYDSWIVVEQDVLPGMGAPLESATRNREYLRSIGL
ncbi:MAG: TIM barrel protein [Chloroflexota bacterium]|nr:TIM barrel protein [Chloroflexota bacterium]MDE2946798.1 TIM barrel protein [Chloroflexota bacterium]